MPTHTLKRRGPDIGMRSNSNPWRTHGNKSVRDAFTAGYQCGYKAGARINDTAKMERRAEKAERELALMRRVA